jgi:hypothetical protein
MMKIKYGFLLLFILVSSVAFTQEEYIKEISDVANSGYHQYLEKIPQGRESLYGFKNRDEFALAKIGKPYQIFLLKKEFFTDSITTNVNYIVPSDEWRVTVMVNNEYRALVTVAKMNGILKVVGIGAAGLASDLGVFEKQHPSSIHYGRILRILQLDCEFLLILPDPLQSGFQTYFLRSADIAFDQSQDDHTSYSLYQVLLMIKNKIENK